MANVYKAWKGAVEPAESSPSANEYQAWKGAVEPVGAAVSFVPFPSPRGLTAGMLKMTGGMQ